ncbi:ABC transporter permease [Synechococcus sp. UW179A]|uniref:ABC transporter permease n=1 Tax=Synechococcus sp. UW179A TaxID=2575510 RepID=UPI000E0E0D6B|nr:ABC transporter permease [Synechococcus sp. UW179A]
MSQAEHIRPTSQHPRGLSFTKSLLRHRELWLRLSEREIAGRYRGSVLGWGWSLLTPLMMLAVYTFVFSTVFKARWGDLEQAGSFGFAINLFAGLITFNLFAECATEAPTLILNNVNYVTKVIFPLESLGVVSVITAVFHAFTSTIVLIVFELIAVQHVPLTIVFLPIVWLPFLLGCLSMSWLLSALGVFLRDLEQVTGVAVSMLMFLSAVFYPLSALPAGLQTLMGLNPLVVVIEQSRRILVQGEMPSLSYVVLGSLLMLALCEFSYRFFCKARRGFADVL